MRGKVFWYLKCKFHIADFNCSMYQWGILDRWGLRCRLILLCYLDAMVYMILLHMAQLILWPCNYVIYLLALQVCECCSYHLLLDGTNLEDQKLQLGGVYTLIVQENNNEIVSKHNIFCYYLLWGSPIK